MSEALTAVSLCCLALAIALLLGTGHFLLPGIIWFGSIVVAILAASFNKTRSKAPVWTLVACLCVPLLGVLVLLVGAAAVFSPH